MSSTMLASRKIGTGAFTPEKSGRTVTLITHTHPAPKFRQGEHVSIINLMHNFFIP